MLQSLGERWDQVPGVPPAGPGDLAHHQGVFVSKDDGMFQSVIQHQVFVSHTVLVSSRAYKYVAKPVTFV